MPSRHAFLSASSSAKWLHCPPSAFIESKMPDVETESMREGTEAHAKAEEKLNNFLLNGPVKVKVECPDKVMDEATTDYRDYVLEVLNAERAVDPDARLRVEEEVDYSPWAPNGFGTSDAIVVSRYHLHIIDFKYGDGVPVKAYKNSQLMLYAAGAMRFYGLLYDFKEITVHIFQPRIGNIDVYSFTVEELKEWLETEVKPKARKAFRGEGDFNPGEWCGFCKARATCRYRAHEMEELALEKMGYVLSTGEIADLLPKLKGIAKWAKDLQDYALQQALNGTEYEGYKVVEGASRRKIVDDLEAMKKLQTAGYQYTDITETKLKTLTDLQKLTGKKELPLILGDTLVKPPGAPTLVPVADKRPAITDKVTLASFMEDE